MNLFRTEIHPSESDFKIDYNTAVLLVGSCFAQNIGQKLMNFGFNTSINPFGVLYNPVSVLNGLNILVTGKVYTENDLIYYNDIWQSFDHYTGFSHKNKEECLRRINTEIERSAKFINNINYLILTFGTSWVYKYKNNGKVVANCHKIPASYFERVFIKSEEIVKIYTRFIKEIRKNLPDLKVVFTVSPVRHWKDGATGNMVSKSNLIMAVHQLVNELPETSYFPSYEIMLDDLRDYRFYKDDMIHPSDMAINYIWEKFIYVYINKETKFLMKEIYKINQVAGHIPSDIHDENYQKLISSNIEKAWNLQQKYGIDLNLIIQELKSKLT